MKIDEMSWLAERILATGHDIHAPTPKQRYHATIQVSRDPKRAMELLMHLVGKNECDQDFLNSCLLQKAPDEGNELTQAVAAKITEGWGEGVLSDSERAVALEKAHQVILMVREGSTLLTRESVAERLGVTPTRISQREPEGWLPPRIPLPSKVWLWWEDEISRYVKGAKGDSE